MYRHFQYFKFIVYTNNVQLNYALQFLLTYTFENSDKSKLIFQNIWIQIVFSYSLLDTRILYLTGFILLEYKFKTWDLQNL
jgi:hypothetical protein